jgi:GTP-binding protein
MTADQKVTDIRKADFLFGAPRLEAIRRHSLPEIAFIGRSNVGKSTFINRLCRRKQLARVSGNPGSTRELNFYQVEGLRDGNPFQVMLVDMPGFGFAKLSKEVREQISELSVSFLQDRPALKVMVLLNDCRRLPEADERAIQAICAREGIHCLIVVTKIDALRTSERVRSVREIAKAYGLEEGDVLVTGEGVSPDAVWGRLLTLLYL